MGLHISTIFSTLFNFFYLHASLEIFLITVFPYVGNSERSFIFTNIIVEDP